MNIHPFCVSVRSPASSTISIWHLKLVVYLRGRAQLTSNNDNDEYVEGEIEEDDDYDEEDAADESEQLLVRLSLGQPGTDDFYTYELWRPKSQGSKGAKLELAAIAVSDLLGFELPNGDVSDDDDEGYFSADTGYDWEIKVAAEGKVDSYLYGILWNLQTYQVSLVVVFLRVDDRRKCLTK